MNHDINKFLQQPRVKQFLRDRCVPNMAKQIIISSDFSIAAKEAVLDCPDIKRLIEILEFGYVR